MEKAVSKRFCDISLCSNESDYVCMECGKDICRLHFHLFAVEGGMMTQVMGSDVVVTGHTCVYCKNGFKKKVMELFKSREK